jgi:(p)ppGpp synthase/HD superfamily hydrolase
MRLMTEETLDRLRDEVPGSVAVRVRSRRASDRFAGLPIAHAAFAFAFAGHAGQHRAVDHTPFIAHPIEVGRLLARHGQPDEVIAAGLLHDLLEKTATTSTELRRLFGIDIVRLVESVSDDPSIGDYVPRKHELRDRVARSDPDICAIFAADKISKVRELPLLPARQRGEPKARAELAHYRASLEMLRRVAGDLALVQLLGTELGRPVTPGVPRSDYATAH